jgi:hypothetical protein
MMRGQTRVVNVADDEALSQLAMARSETFPIGNVKDHSLLLRVRSRVLGEEHLSVMVAVSRARMVPTSVTILLRGAKVAHKMARVRQDVNMIDLLLRKGNRQLPNLTTSGDRA